MSSDDLPVLGVPSVAETRERVMRQLKVVAKETEYETAKKDLDDLFMNSASVQAAQKTIHDSYSNGDSWVTKSYIDCNFLENRTPLISNEINLFNDIFKSDPSLPLMRKVAKIVKSFDEVIDKIRRGAYRPDLKGRKINIQTMDNLFASYRLPGETRDVIVNYLRDPTRRNYIAVTCNFHFYELHLVGEDGKPLSVDQIEHQLNKIISASQNPAPPIGAMTAVDRDAWYKNFNFLRSDPINRSSIESIERSLFVLCIDLPPSEDFPEENQNSLMQICFSDGHNIGNRWFDKIIQVVVTSEGQLGYILDHSAADGIVCQTWVKDMIKIYHGSHVEHNGTGRIKEPVYLPFLIPPNFEQNIYQAVHEFQRLRENVDAVSERYCGLGFDFLRERRISAMAFSCISLNLAFYRIHRLHTLHCATASLGIYHQGRIVEFYTSSPEFVSFCQLIDDKNVPLSEKLTAFMKSIERIVEEIKYTKENGGSLMHLCAMELQIPSYLPMDDRFIELVYSLTNFFGVSVSILEDTVENWSSAEIPGVAVGCYYVQIMMYPKHTVAHITANKECVITPELRRFAKEWTRSMSDLHSLLIRKSNM